MARAEAPEKGRKLAKPIGALLKAAFAFHVVAITCWSLPSPPPGVVNGRIEPFGSDYLLLFNDQYMKNPAVARYMTWTGFWQYWDMFSPDPSDTDIWGDAEVVFLDGGTRRYEYPRMYVLSIPEKYVKERYRKFYERANLAQHSYLWPVFAQRIARLMYVDPENPPVIVRLRRHWMPIPKPGKPLPAEYASFAYYEHTVDLQNIESARQSP